MAVNCNYHSRPRHDRLCRQHLPQVFLQAIEHACYVALLVAEFHIEAVHVLQRTMADISNSRWLVGFVSFKVKLEPVTGNMLYYYPENSCFAELFKFSKWLP